MMSVSRNDLATALCNYFAQTVAVERGKEGLVAILPHKDLFGDSVALYIDVQDEGIALTDGGFIQHELASMTGSVKADADVWQRVHAVAARYGVAFDGGELNVFATNQHELGSAAFALATSIVESLQVARFGVSPVGIQFWEEVELFLTDHHVAHETGVKIAGISGARHKVDFALRNGSLHVAQAIASEQSMRRSLNIFYDLTEADKSIQAVAIVDDEREGYSNATFQQLAYKAKVFQWRRRDEFIDYWRGINQRRPYRS